MGTSFEFVEKMAGTYAGKAPGFPGGAFVFELEVRSDDLSQGVRTVHCRARGWLTMQGVVTDAPAEGSLDLSPFWRRTIRYSLDFANPDGRRLHFEGQKDISWLRPLRTWTTLPGTVTDVATGAVVADVAARFDLARDFRALLKSYRFVRARRAEAL